jgi:ABC-2 type transport system permease protein
MNAFWELFRFELAHQARNRATWIYAVVFLALAIVAMTTFVGNARGSIFNTPLAIFGATVVASLLGLLVTAALAGEVATRDAQARIEPILFTAPIAKWAYLGGRMLGAFGLNALLLTAVPVGIIVAALFQRADPDLVGPFRPAAYLGAYVFLALPNAFITTALLFSAATLTRSAVASYVGALFLFLSAMVIEGALAEAMGRWELAKLLDPFGIVLVRELVTSWTPVQKDTLSIGLEGALVWNRLLWLAFAIGALALTHVRFRFAHHTTSGRRKSGARTEPLRVDQPLRSAPLTVPHAARTFGFPTRARQTLDIASRSFAAVVLSRGALVLAFPAVFLLLFGPQLTKHFNTPLLPTTAYIIGIFVSSADIFFYIAAPFLIVVYAGEMVWREREAGLSEIADATPVPEWVFFCGKLLGLSLVLVVLQASMIAAAMLLQAGMNYYDFEIELYSGVLFGLQLSEYLLFAVLALAVHVVVNHKYVGHLVVLLAYAFTVFATEIGLEHNLLVYASDPGWTYSDMRGYGPFLAPFVWFKFYWAGWALLLAVAAKLLWLRGNEGAFARRLQLARRRLTRHAIAAAAAAMAIVLATGGFIFYNTNVLNGFSSAADRLEWRAGYERRYGRFEGLSQPQLTGARLRVEIYPERGEADIRGSFHLVNMTGDAIEAVHLTTSSRVETRALAFDRATKNTLSDNEHGYHIHALETPLRPGESLRLDFEVHFKPHGFSNSGIDASVAANGTYFAQHEWLPAVGYQPQRELNTDADRRAHGLDLRPALRSLDDVAARRDVAGAERIAFDAIVGTSEGQTAIAPGALQRTWIEGGRRYFHYVADAPIRNDYAFYSAAYALREAQWKDVSIQVVHHPSHASNVDRIVRSAQASLEYYSKHFGPYPYAQIRFVEHPGDGNGLHSAPINISYEEGFSLLDPDDDPRGLDFPFAVVAHEVAHQWWGNQVTPAEVEGAALVSESLSWYSAMGVVEEAYGHDHLERLLHMMREAYLAPQARGAVPLLRADDWFHVYRKGAFAMFALREYVGAERVNTALRRLLDKHGSGAVPLPTSLDLYSELQAVTPEALHPLLADLFEANTFWELKTERVHAEQADGDNWRVMLDVKARKVVVDANGVETEIPMDDLVEVGVFAGEPSYLGMHRIRSGKQRITLLARGKPARAGIDPRNLLIDVTSDDNSAVVQQ